jgi:hypothetical protein
MLKNKIFVLFLLAMAAVRAWGADKGVERKLSWEFVANAEDAERFYHPAFNVFLVFDSKRIAVDEEYSYGNHCKEGWLSRKPAPSALSAAFCQAGEAGFEFAVFQLNADQLSISKRRVYLPEGESSSPEPDIGAWENLKTMSLK